MPGQCFISHAYNDEVALAACMQRRLPHGWQAFVFPPLTVTPDEAVSERLVDAIRAADGLIHLATPLSRASFWVGFERSMAARLGKPVYAFHPRRPLLAFTRDRRVAAEPIVSILFNLAVPEDVERIGAIRAAVWDRYRFEIRGDQWRRLDNEARQMLDSVEGLRKKYAAGGVALLFLSTASVTAGLHDYADPSTFRRAQKDMETPVGHVAERMAALDPNRTLLIWLDPPDRRRIEAALERFPSEAWAPYVAVVRASLDDPAKLVVGRPGGGLDLNHLDTMLARCLWAAGLRSP